MTNNYSAVIFDLDGTLLDTLPDIATAANEVLANLNLPTHPLDDFRFLVGSGVAMLFRRALPPDEATDSVVADCVERFQETYGRSWNVHTKCFDQIPELLDALVGRGIKLAVLSNKPDMFTKQCVAKYLGQYGFDPILGQRDGVPRKPDPLAAHEIAKQHGVPAQQTLYIGDTAIDMQTAKCAGMFAVGAVWGYRPREELVEHGADLLIETPLDLLQVFSDPA